jgi:molecular chaperone DnaJ
LKPLPLVSRGRLLELLGLHASATQAEIKSRYRELARKFHPDVNGGDDRAHARFRAIVAASEELLAANADAPARLDRTGTATTMAAGSMEDIADPTSASVRSGGDEIARRRAELQTRRDQCERTVRRAQAEVRDGDAKAVAARKRGNDQMARHFERRVEADRSRIYALLGELSGLERELRGLEAGPGGESEGRMARRSSRSGLDPAERLNREVRSVNDEELAALKKRYESDDSGR